MTRHLRAAEPLPDDQRIGLARSILAHAAGHEQRAIDEALAALDGAGIEQLAHDRNLQESD